MVDTSERATLKRVDEDPVIVVGSTSARPPAYADALGAAGYEIALIETAQKAAIDIAGTMPRVVILSTSVPMPDHRLIHEAAIAVSAEVLIFAPDAEAERVCHEVDRASARATERRGG